MADRDILVTITISGQDAGANAELTAIITRLEQLNATAKEAVAALSGTTQAAVANTSAVGNAGAAAERAGGSYANMQRSMMFAAGGLAFLSAGLGKLEADVVSAASAYQAEMTKVQTLTGQTADDMAMMNQRVLDMALTLPASAQDLAEGLYFVTSAGFQGADAMQILETSAKASAVGMGETKDIGDALTTVLRAYGMQAGDAATITDQMTEAIVLGKVEADTMATSLGRVIPLAAYLGVTFAEVQANIATLTHTGMSAEMAATSLNQALTVLVKPSKEAQETLAALGTSAAEVRQEIKDKGLLAAFQHLMELTGGNVEVLAKLFPNVRALRDILGTTGDQAQWYAMALDKITNAHGLLDEAFATTSKTIAFQLGQIRNHFHNLAIVLGEEVLPAILPVLLKIVDGLTGLLTKLATVNPAMLEFAAVVAAVLAAAGPVVLMLAMLSFAFDTLIPEVFIVIAALAALSATAVVVAANWDQLTAKFPQLETAAHGAAGAFDFLKSHAIEAAAGIITPFTIVIDQAIALGKVLEGLFGSLGHFASGLAALATGDFAAAAKEMDAAKQSAKDLGAALLDAVTKFTPGEIASQFQKSKDGLQGFVDGLKDAAKTESIQAEALHKVNTAWAQNAEFVKVAADELLHWDRVQLAIDNNARITSDAIKLWEGKLSAAKDALKMLDDEQKRNGSLTAEQSQQYQTLTWYTQRVGNGIRDDLNPAYIAAQVAAATFMKQQDELKKALDAGKITTEQYNKAVIDAAIAADPAAKAAKDLALSQKEVADVTQRIIDRLFKLMEALGLIPKDTEIKINAPGLDNLREQLGGIKNDIDRIPKNTVLNFQVQIDKMIREVPAFAAQAANDAGQAIADRLQAHSPPKTGPLSTGLNWQGLMDPMVPAAANAAESAASVTAATWQAASVKIGKDATDALASGLYDGPVIEKTAKQAAQAAATVARAEAKREAQDIVSEWQAMFNALPDLVSGAGTQKLQDQLDQLTLSFQVGTALGAPQAVLDDLAKQIANVSDEIAQLTQAATLDAVKAAQEAAADAAKQKALEDWWTKILADPIAIASGKARDDARQAVEQAQMALLIAQAEGAPQAVIDALEKSYAQARAEFERIGRLMADPMVKAFASEAALKAQQMDFWNWFGGNIDKIGSGEAIKSLEDFIDKTTKLIEFAKAHGAPQDYIDSLQKQVDDAKAKLGQVGAIINDAVAAGIIADPNKPISEAVWKQIAEGAKKMGDAASSLVPKLFDAYAAGKITLEQFQSVITDKMLPALQQLRDSIYEKYIQALLDGSDEAAKFAAQLQVVDDIIKKTQVDASQGVNMGGWWLIDPNGNRTAAGGGSNAAGYGPDWTVDNGDYGSPGSPVYNGPVNNVTPGTPLSANQTHVYVNVDGRIIANVSRTHIGNSVTLPLSVGWSAA